MLRFRTLGFAAVILFGAASARAEVGSEDQIEALFERLRNAEKPPTRVTAARDLGTAGDVAAVRPLCEALGDSSESVRRAAAEALSRFPKSGALECLKGHSEERNAGVRKAVGKSIETLEAIERAGALPPLPKKGDKLYVAIGMTSDKSGRGEGDVASLVSETMRAKLLASSKVALAPDGEAPAKARAVLMKHKLKGYMLQTVVDEPEYSDSKLTVMVRVTMWTYPGKALEGAFTPKVSIEGVKPGDPDAEKSLIQAAVERAVDAFVATTLPAR